MVLFQCNGAVSRSGYSDLITQAAKRDKADLARWEEEFCLPFYKGGWTDLSTVYLESQKFYSRCTTDGETVDLGGIISASCGGAWAGLNLGFVSQPVRSAERFHPKVARALDHFKRRGWPWLLVVPDRWVAPGRQDQISGLLDSLGFHLAMNSPVVTADKLRDPEESPLEIRSAGDENDWAAIASVNAEGWGVPAAWVLPLLASEKFQSEARGWIGWFSGQPVCATVTFPALEFTYCAWGATIPAYRKHGFASQMLRYAAAQAGRNRPVFAVLGPSGLRTYRDAGFMTREQFRLYLAPG